MASRRIPSQSQLRSQMRAAQRKAESQFKRDVKKVEDKLNRDLKRWEQDANRKLRAARPRVTYTSTERAYLMPVQEQVQRQVEKHPERRDVFLCHAWEDRETSAKDLHDHLANLDVRVWFSENDIVLGTSLIREIDKGLRMSHMGVVLVTPAMLKSLSHGGVAEKELSALLATDRVVPIVHGITFEDLREESPLLASRSGLSTDGESLETVAIKVANTIHPEAL